MSVRPAVDVLRAIVAALEARHNLKYGKSLREWAQLVATHENRRAMFGQRAVAEAQATLDAYAVLDQESAP